MDDKDSAILSLLSQNARLSLSDIGRRVGLSPPAVSERVSRLEAAGVLTGYRARLNYAKLGRTLEAFVRLSVSYKKEEAFAEFAYEQPEVLECWHLLGEYNFMLKVAVTSTEALDDLLKNKLSRYGQTISHVILRDSFAGCPVKEIGNPTEV